MTEEKGYDEFPISRRAVFWCVAVIAVIVFLCSGGFERVFFPTTIFSKDSFTPSEQATLTEPLDFTLPPSARVILASYDKHFGPGEGRITVCLKMPAEEASAFQDTLKKEGAHLGTVYLPLGCRLPEWREASKTIDTAYITTRYIYVARPIDGEVCVYYEFDDYDGRCSKILSQGKRRWALPRE